MNSTTTPS